MRIKAFDFWLLAKAAVTLLLCLVTTIGFANPDMIFNGLEYEYKYEKKRVIDANFEAKANYNLYLNGKYSDYKIVTWNENRVSFHVEIIVKSNREDVAKEAVNNIDVEFNNRKDEATIEARTVFKKNTFKNISYEIDYYVMIPKDLYLVIDNSYGNVEIDKLNKTLDLKLDYGNFSIDSIFTDAMLDVDYGNVKVKYADKVKAVIDYGNIRINSGNEVDVKMSYGNMNLDDVKTLDANCRYSDVTCSDADYANLDMQYSDIYLKKIKEVTIDGRYSDVEIDRLLKKINFVSDYGDIEIDNVDRDFELIDINANYADADITLSDGNSFSYDISVTYGDINNYYLKDKSTRYIKEDNMTSLKGSFNDATKAHYINIDLRYGDLDFDF